MAHGHRRITSGHLVRATLAGAVEHARAHGVDLDAQTPSPARDPHPAATPIGTVRRLVRTVGPQDTAAAIGHPDSDVDVLSSPTIALWFELAASDLMPPPGVGLRHVGVGIVVHHLDAARVGDEVEVTAEVTSVDGRAVRFACDAVLGGSLIATGDHHRVILDVPR